MVRNAECGWHPARVYAPQTASFDNGKDANGRGWGWPWRSLFHFEMNRSENRTTTVATENPPVVFVSSEEKHQPGSGREICPQVLDADRVVSDEKKERAWVTLPRRRQKPLIIWRSALFCQGNNTKDCSSIHTGNFSCGYQVRITPYNASAQHEPHCCAAVLNRLERLGVGRRGTRRAGHLPVTKRSGPCIGVALATSLVETQVTYYSSCTYIARDLCDMDSVRGRCVICGSCCMPFPTCWARKKPWEE
ncbi:hypothetical protein L209DRAFT_751593 [Thermothelomyces heterothallicus CBS 203.75]